MQVHTIETVYARCFEYEYGVIGYWCMGTAHLGGGLGICFMHARNTIDRYHAHTAPHYD